MDNYPLINRFLCSIIERRRELPNPENSNLLAIINKNKGARLEDLLKELEGKVDNLEKIFEILPELNDKVNPDEKIDDMIAELRGASWLINKDYKKLKFCKKSFDYSCEKNDQKYAVEVEFIRGPNFKRQKRIGAGLAYKLNSLPEIRKIKDKIEKGFSQISQEPNKIVIIVTNNFEMNKFWFGNNVEQYRKTIEQELESKVVILTNGDIYD